MLKAVTKLRQALMKHIVPKYSLIELEEIIYSEPILPEDLSEQTFNEEIKTNSRLKWKFNLSLFKPKAVNLVLNDELQTKVKKLRSFNWIIAIFVIVNSLWVQDYKLLLTLCFIPFIKPGFIGHGTFLVLAIISVGLKTWIGISNNYFWFFFLVLSPVFILNRLIQEFIERSLLKGILSDFKIFWKYYSNQLIYIDLPFLNSEYQTLIEKYPVLNKKNLS